MDDIDFTQWTDMQLDVAKNYPSAHHFALNREIARRVQEGTWMTDGSRERVNALISSNRGVRRRGKRS